MNNSDESKEQELFDRFNERIYPMTDSLPVHVVQHYVSICNDEMSKVIAIQNNKTQELVLAVKALLNDIYSEDVSYPNLEKVYGLAYSSNTNPTEHTVNFQLYDPKKVEEWMRLKNKTSFTLEELISISK